MCFCKSFSFCSWEKCISGITLACLGIVGSCRFISRREHYEIRAHPSRARLELSLEAASTAKGGMDGKATRHRVVAGSGLRFDVFDVRSATPDVSSRFRGESVRRSRREVVGIGEVDLPSPHGIRRAAVFGLDMGEKYELEALNPVCYDELKPLLLEVICKTPRL